MPRRKPSLSLSAGLDYAYPEHLREQLVGLPAAPGVYLFHGEAEGEPEGMPLYIGKSVNIRARVMAHFRAQEEAALLRQTVRISFVRTAGDVGAQLLEAQMIKLRQPLHNRLLRRNRQLCSLAMRDGKPEVVDSRSLDFAKTPDLFGLFRSRRAALEALHTLADMHHLCYGALGLERLVAGRPCFRRMIYRCNGVCEGAEPLEAHQARLRDALEGMRVAVWPYAGAIGLVESFEGTEQILVVNNWCFLGFASDVDAARKLGAVAAGFDADGYKILCRPIMMQFHRLVDL